jgi:hypothetical protein
MPFAVIHIHMFVNIQHQLVETVVKVITSKVHHLHVQLVLLENIPTLTVWLRVLTVPLDTSKDPLPSQLVIFVLLDISQIHQVVRNPALPVVLDCFKEATLNQHAATVQLATSLQQLVSLFALRVMWVSSLHLLADLHVLNAMRDCLLTQPLWEPVHLAQLDFIKEVPDNLLAVLVVLVSLQIRLDNLHALVVQLDLTRVLQQ